MYRRIVSQAFIALTTSVGALGAQATITGLVRDDSTNRSIAGVEITLDSLPRMTLTDATGHFVFRDLPIGVHHLHVQLTGFRGADLPLQLTAGQPTSVDVHLARAIPRLAPMAVVEEKHVVSRGYVGFEDRRKQGIGRFIGSEKLRENEERRLEDVLREFPGLTIVSPPACGKNRMTCETNPSKRIATTGGCPVQVSIDGALVYRGRGGTIDWSTTFDINEMAVANLSGIEFYRNDSEVPPLLAPPGMTCGLIAFWTRHD